MSSLMQAYLVCVNALHVLKQREQFKLFLAHICPFAINFVDS